MVARLRDRLDRALRLFGPLRPGVPLTTRQARNRSLAAQAVTITILTAGYLLLLLLVASDRRQERRIEELERLNRMLMRGEMESIRANLEDQ